MTIESNKNKLPKAQLSKLTIDELSIVDRPCQEPATVALMKRAPELKAGTVAKRGLLTSAESGHSHLLDDCDGAGAGYTSCECMGEGNDATYHSHPWSRDDAGNIVIGMSANHSHVVLDPANTDAAVTEVAMRALGATAKSTPAIATPTVNNIKPSPTERTTMKTLEEQIADLTKRADQIRKLSTTEHALWKSLDAEIADAFLAKSVADRAAEMTEFAKSNAIEYTADDGTAYTKSQGQMAKLHKMADDERKLRLDGEVAKRAADLFGAIAGPDDARINLLKRIESESDGTKREAMEAVIRAAAGVMKAAGVAKGAGGVGDPTVGNAEDAMTALEKGLVGFCKAQGITKNLWTDGLDAYKRTPEGEALKRAHDEAIAS